jgi:hypothetical protein
MSTPIIIMASMLTLEPPTPIPTKIDHVTVEQSSDAAHVLAYDSDGEVTGEIILSHETVTDETGEPAEELHVDAIFADGAYMFSVLTDDGEQTVESQGNAAAHIAEVQAVLIDIDTKAKWWKCAGEVGLAALAIIEVKPVVATATTEMAACECLPLIVDEFAEMECFSGSGE